ncbi:MAG: TIGR04053 family radical SAM/SPASM domain-containing protein [Candidatus Obscuribacterales bacterium]|nr:TIGR04053 family radical SAM/SPASM domain-containing protein [Candidatus Obscuribacterales bacterium]
MSDNGFRPTPIDFNHAPFLVLWELTRACALACKHCRAKAQPDRDPCELNIADCKAMLDEMKEFGKPLIVLTGGDPAMRPDLFEIIHEIRSRGFSVAMTPSATPQITRDTIKRLKEAGLSRLAISIDAPRKQEHDRFRGVEGSFFQSMEIIDWASQESIPVQINTTICSDNINLFDDMARLVEELKAVLWSVFFLVPVGRASNQMQISPSQAEHVMIKMSRISQSASFDIKSTAAPQFRRVLMQRSEAAAFSNDWAVTSDLSKLESVLRLGALRSYGSVNDGKGLIFVSHTGDVMPSGFLPLTTGNVKVDSLVDLYRDAPIFTELRDSTMLKGKCGACRYRSICGGSRARAFAASGDYMTEDPLCLYRDRKYSCALSDSLDTSMAFKK